MKRTFILIPLLAAALAVVGCERGSPPSSSDKEKPKAGGQTGDQKIQAALAKLSAEDRAIAEEQRLCPKSGGRLGSMGTPVKLMLKGQPVFICCSSCEEEAEKDQDGMLKKVAELKKK